jgi:hypothetical protein
MQFINSEIDGASSLYRKLKKFLRMGSKNAFTRIVTLTFFISLFPMGYWGFASYYIATSDAQSKYNSRLSGLMTQQNILKTTIQSVELCIKSKKENDKLSDWYCEDALDSYKRRSEHWPPERREQLIGRLAYEGMKIDLKYYLMVNENRQRTSVMIDTKEQLFVKYFFSEYVVYFLSSMMLFTAGFVAFSFYGEKAHNNPLQSDK